VALIPGFAFFYKDSAAMRLFCRAVMRSCGHAVMRSCGHAVIQSCGHAVVQLLLNGIYRSWRDRRSV